MGFHRGPHIITDGLVLALDAGNTKSYISPSGTWFDKSGFGNNGTLTNGPTFNSGNGGSIVFDKVNDYINVIPINRVATTTLEVWFKASTTSTNSANRQYLYTQQRNPPTLTTYTYQERQGMMIAGDYILFQYLNTINSNATVSTNAATILPNVWYQVAATLDGTTPKIYINGISVNVTVTGTTTSKSLIVNQGFIGLRGDNQGTDYFGGSMAVIRDYNRALTAQEIQQNYNATKSRYGL